jgi:hypothetical protein
MNLEEFEKRINNMSPERKKEIIDILSNEIELEEQRKIDLIMKFNWQTDFREGERNHFIFNIAGAFCEYGINQTSAEGLGNHGQPSR